MYLFLLFQLLLMQIKQTFFSLVFLLMFPGRGELIYKNKDHTIIFNETAEYAQ